MKRVIGKKSHKTSYILSGITVFLLLVSNKFDGRTSIFLKLICIAFFLPAIIYGFYYKQNVFQADEKGLYICTNYKGGFFIAWRFLKSAEVLTQKTYGSSLASHEASNGTLTVEIGYSSQTEELLRKRIPNVIGAEKTAELIRQQAKEYEKRAFNVKISAEKPKNQEKSTAAPQHKAPAAAKPEEESIYAFPAKFEGFGFEKEMESLHSFDSFPEEKSSEKEPQQVKNLQSAPFESFEKTRTNSAADTTKSPEETLSVAERKMLREKSGKKIKNDRYNKKIR